MEAGPSTQHDASPSRMSITVPTNLLILPPSAAAVGLIIGMSRGGSRARLRFLAENAHRQPRTVQGWYFYTKTRNYRVFFGAAKTGAKYALGLCGATAGFVLLDESIGWAREQIFEPGQRATANADELTQVEKPRRTGWRTGPVRWEDGAVAGTVMGAVVGISYRLPRPLFTRAIIMGAILGGATSALQIAQDLVANLRDEAENSDRTTASTSPSSSKTSRDSTSMPAPELGMLGTERPAHPIVDRTMQPSSPPSLDPATSAPILQSETAQSAVPYRNNRSPSSWWDPRGWLGR